ncbi:hypothetical protein K443DRAFT_680424 [Laccaria amethystina LaAM-08-1]|uniref:Uncharacterized protein n=1 Tax=Laccaria amethystina LaAM-08-1 TaxID=1095629 RepID=A0A0C9X143_9AGAR|nr:hypothetical protein K443DRAFT_680424 [Laccaria amethystina LaAM-08-1]
MGLSACTKILRTISSPSLLPLFGYTPLYDPLPVRRLHHHMTYSPSTSSYSALPFSKLAVCFTTTQSSPSHIRLPSPFSPYPQTWLQSSECYASYSACLSQFPATLSIHVRSPICQPRRLHFPLGVGHPFLGPTLVDLGRDTTLNESDVWNLSPTMQSHPIFVKFSAIVQLSLDLILDFSLTFVSVVFNDAGCFFLKRILDAMDLEYPTSESQTRAYIYAFLSFTCRLLKAHADVQHLWYGLPASTRIRSGLMAAIYDKALKRKDFSGVVNKEEKDKHKDKTTTDDNCIRVYMDLCFGISTIVDPGSVITNGPPPQNKKRSC